jgi:hypothetical protein
VTSVTQANNATNVSTATAVTVQFSEALDPATVNSSTIQLLDSSGNAVAASGTYNSSTDTAPLTPNAALAASSTYTILVHGGSNGPVIESSAYNPLAAKLTSNTIVPVGQSVSITINGVTQSATVGADGSFSASFATGGLGVGTYIITYSYAGNTNFTAASSTRSLTVAYGAKL